MLKTDNDMESEDDENTRLISKVAQTCKIFLFYYAVGPTIDIKWLSRLPVAKFE